MLALDKTEVVRLISDPQHFSWRGSDVSELHPLTERPDSVWTRLVEGQWDHVSDCTFSQSVMMTKCELRLITRGLFHRCDSADTAAATWVTQPSSAFLREVQRWCFAAAPAALSCLSAPPTAASTSANVRAMLPPDDSGSYYNLISVYSKNKCFIYILYLLHTVYFLYRHILLLKSFHIVNVTMNDTIYHRCRSFLGFFSHSSVSWGSLPVRHGVVCGKRSALWWPGWLSGWERWGFLLYVNFLCVTKQTSKIVWHYDI